MNYWIVKAQLTAMELDAKQKELIAALRRRAPNVEQLQRAWDVVAEEMNQLNQILKRRSAALREARKG
jgi:hypothetical protein